MESKDTKKYAIYSRKSKFTGKGESIENQITKCKEYLKFHYDEDNEDSIIMKTKATLAKIPIVLSFKLC